MAQHHQDPDPDPDPAAVTATAGAPVPASASDRFWTSYHEAQAAADRIAALDKVDAASG